MTKLDSVLSDKLYFCDLPTSLEKVEKVSKTRDVNLYIKRDDKTGGLALGGNKARKLEYVLFQALKEKADTIVTVGSVQSNHARITTAAANRLGLVTKLILIGKPPSKMSGNLLLDSFMGADIQFVASEEVNQKIAELLINLQNSGSTPYFIPGGAHSVCGVVAYINFFNELREQFEHKKLEKPRYLVTATGTGSTQAGIIIGNEFFGWKGLEVIGISIARPKELCKRIIKESIQETSAILDLDLEIDCKKIIVYDDFIGKGYGIADQKTIKSMTFLARSEGIILDPTYTAKAYQGMIELIDRGVIQKGKTVVFLHTGGIPIFFSDDFVKNWDRGATQLEYIIN